MKCSARSERCARSSATCPNGSHESRNGWRTPESRVPNPWVALAWYGEEVNLVRSRISEPARYYHSDRTIVVRKGLLVAEERRHLWHELQHVRRADEHWCTDERAERHVERVAVRLAIPTCSLQWAAYQTETMHDLADLLKLPQDWVEFRWRTAPQWERDLIRRHDPVYGVHISTLDYP